MQNSGIEILYPCGELFISQKNSTFDSRYKFTAKELDNELRSNRRTPLKSKIDVRQTNYTYFGARYYDSDLSSWLSVDPMASKYPNEGPYTFVSNNPIIFIDIEGNDKVYFDCSGNEVKRIKSNKVFKTYVQTGTRYSYFGSIQIKAPIYSRVPMPGVIKGYEDAKYQTLDYQLPHQHLFLIKK